MSAIASTHSMVTFTEFAKMKERIGLDQSFQVGNYNEGRWSNQDKTKFIESIVMDMNTSTIIIVDIAACLSKLIPGSDDHKYFQRWKDDGYSYISVDGNNRSITMHDFYHDRARLHPRKRYYIETSDGRVADFTLTQDSYHYSKLPDALREKIDNSMIHLISVTRATRAQLTDLFLRVNSGAPLNGQEKRNAIISLVAENVRSISSKYEDSIASCFMAHKSIIRLGFHESIASWLCMYTHASRPVTINNSVLDRAYATNSAEEQNLVSFLSLANNTLEGVSKHASLFRSAKFKKFNLHNLFLLVNHLDANRYQIKDYSKFLSWFVTTEMARVRSTEHVYTTIHATSKQYSELTTDDASTFSTRLRTMLSDFNQSTLEEDSVIVSLDPNRIATPKQRYDLWVKQNHHCTLSKKFIPLREIYDASKWQADHYPIRHTDGGPTTVENMRLISKEEHSKVTAAQNSRKSA